MNTPHKLPVCVYDFMLVVITHTMLPYQNRKNKMFLVYSASLLWSPIKFLRPVLYYGLKFVIFLNKKKTLRPNSGYIKLVRKTSINHFHKNPIKLYGHKFHNKQKSHTHRECNTIPFSLRIISTLRAHPDWTKTRNCGNIYTRNYHLR